MNKKIILLFVFILFIAFRSQAEDSIVSTYDFYVETRESFQEYLGANAYGVTEEGFSCRVLFEDPEFGMGPSMRIQVLRQGYITEGLHYRFETPTQNMTVHSGYDGYAYAFVNSMNSRISIYFGSTFYSVEIIQSEYQRLFCQLQLQ